MYLRFNDEQFFKKYNKIWKKNDKIMRTELKANQLMVIIIINI